MIVSSLRLCVLLAAVSLVGSSATAAEAASLTLEFDAGNRISYFRDGLLVIVRDDVASTVSIAKRFEKYRDPIELDVRNLRYRDVDSIWIVSRLGRRLNGAILYDIRNDRIIKRYWGQVFSVSPNGEHLAFAYPSGMLPSVLFVDDSMIYPRVEHGFVTCESDGPAKVDGRAWYDFSDHDDPVGSQLVSPLRWRDDRTLEAIIRRASSNGYGGLVMEDAEASYLRLVATIEYRDGPEPPEIKVDRFPLERDEVRWEVNRIREEAGLPRGRPPRLRLR